MSNKISCVYIASVCSYASGGTEVLHQLAYKLKRMKVPVKMYYYNSFDKADKASPVPQRFVKYDIEYTFKVQDSGRVFIIIPEIAVFLVNNFRKAECCIWWLSVDFYFKFINSTLEFKKLMFRFLLKGQIEKAFAYWKRTGFDPFSNRRKTLKHWVQSEYAKRFLIDRGVEEKSIAYLSDFLNNTFISKVNSEKQNFRDDKILYNPKKGKGKIEELIRLFPHLKIIPIQDMDPEEVATIMLHSKIYVDFGNHPGKDRIPREAAICGCVVITNRNGSAAFEEDVPIERKYKIEEDNKFATTFINLVHSIFDNFESHTVNFDSYRKKIEMEEVQFEKDLNKIIHESFGFEDEKKYNV